jgi:hypothetical protein
MLPARINPAPIGGYVANGATVDSVSVRPDGTTIGAETKIELADHDEEVDDDNG